MDFWSNALPFMEKKGVKQKDIATKTGHSGGRVSDWFSRKIVPKADDALIIADMLDVSVRYLVTGEDDSELSEREKELLKVCSFLSENKFNAVLEVAKTMRKEEERELRDGSSSGVSDKEGFSE